MFDASRFTASVAEVLSLLKSVGDGVGWQFGTLGFEARLRGRGVPKMFTDMILDLEQSSNASAHARIAARSIIATQLPLALRRVRAQYAKASGGLPRAEWMGGVFEFCLVNSGSVALQNWEMPDLKKTPRGGSLPFPYGPSGPADIARRLSAHARLDLSGPLRTFEVAKRGSTALPFCIKAPTPGHAVARMSILFDDAPQCWTHVREVQDSALAAQHAKDLIGA